MLEDMSLGEGSSTLVSGQSPLRAGGKLARLDGEEIPQNSSKQNLGRGETRCGARVVAVCEECSSKEIIVKAAIILEIVPDQAFG